MIDDNGDHVATCDRCYYYQKQLDPRNLGSQHGACRRYPPTIVPIPVNNQVQITAMIPPIQPDHWCGEFVPKNATIQVQ